MTIGAPALAQQIGPDTIRLERLLDAPIERVWAFLVEPDKRRQWFADGPLEAKAGGTLSFTFDHDTLSRAKISGQRSRGPLRIMRRRCRNDQRMVPR